MGLLSIILVVLFLGNVLGHTNNREAAEVLIRLTVFYLLCRVVWNVWTQRTFYLAASVTLLGVLIRQAQPEFGQALYLAGPALGLLGGLVLYGLHVFGEGKKRGAKLFTARPPTDKENTVEKSRVLN
jgi:hypothetical protein